MIRFFMCRDGRIYVCAEMVRFFLCHDGKIFCSELLRFSCAKIGKISKIGKIGKFSIAPLQDTMHKIVPSVVSFVHFKRLRGLLYAEWLSTDLRISLAWEPVQRYLPQNS